MKNKFVRVTKKKWLKSAILTIVLFAIIISAYVGIMYVINKYTLPDFDFTKNKIYSISQATKDKLQNMEEDITIYLYNMQQYVNDLTHKYTNVNKHIKVEELKDLTSKLEWKTDYGVDDDSHFIVVESEEKEKILSNADLSAYDYTSYEEYDVTEEAITNAILDVITNVKPKVYFLKGHNAYSEENFEYIEDSLISEVNEVEFVDLLVKGKIPDDCKILVITALREDITEKEKDLILKYINNGGEILILADPNVNNIKTPNFNKVLDEYGVSIADGMVFERDSNKMLSGAPNFIISTINGESEIVKNINMDLNLCVKNATKLNIASSEELEEKNVTSEILATLSDKAFYRTDFTINSLSKTSKDEDASEAPIAAMFTKKNGENTSKMIIFANTVFATNQSVAYGGGYGICGLDMYNNRDILLNTVSYLTEREDNITIRKDREDISTYDVSDAQRSLVLGIIFAIPAFIVVVGIVIWVLRRRKK